MSSIILGFEYDIFISYRQKDNKGDRWVSEFVEALKTELESTFKEEISVYFDINPHDGLLETHDVDASLKDKLKCLVFIPIISRTYCDPKSFAWEHEFKAFVEQASKDQFGLKVKLPNGNVTNRIIPIQIHELHLEDKTLIEKELGGVLRAIEFIYKEPGVNRPLSINDDEKLNLNKTKYRNQINKVANALEEIIHSLKEKQTTTADRKLSNEQATYSVEEIKGKDVSETVLMTKKSKRWMIIFLAVLFCTVALFAIYKFIGSSKQVQKLSTVDKSIAVLPFVNDSPDKENEYFCNGMMDEILNQLQKISDLKVKSRTDVEKYRNAGKDIKVIGHELGVSLIMEGSVRKVGDDIRITAQLIDAKTSDHIWSETYDGKYTFKIFDFQSSVAKKVAASLKAVITPLEKEKINAKPVTNMSAYDLYLKGNEMISKWHYTGDSTYSKLALNSFNQALELDSEYIEALNGEKQLYVEVGNYDSALFFLEKIQKIDPSNLMAIEGKGLIYFYTNKPDSALKCFNKVLNSGTAGPWQYLVLGQIYYLFKNDLIKGLPYYQKAYDLGGASEPEINRNIGRAYLDIEYYQKALKYYKNALSLRSECDLLISYDNVLFTQGKYDEAIHILDSLCNINACEQKCDIMRFYIYTMQNELEKAEKYFNKAVDAGYKRLDDDDICLAYIYKETGRRNEALPILYNSIKTNENLLKSKVTPWDIQSLRLRLSIAYSILDENKKALHYLSELEKSGLFQGFFNVNAFNLKTFSGFDNLHNDPEFKAIVKRIEDQRAATRAKVREMEENGELHL